MEEYVDESILTTIVKNYDYSNAVVGKEQFQYIVNYLDSLLKNFFDILSKEEEKNKTIKQEIQHYDFKKDYDTGFRTNLRNSKVGYKSYDNIELFKSDYNNNFLENLEYVELELNLSFKRGIGYTLEKYSNKFIISFKPYNISFSRKSDHNVMLMNSVEENIKSMLDQLPTINTIFYTKGE